MHDNCRCDGTFIHRNTGINLTFPRIKQGGNAAQLAGIDYDWSVIEILIQNDRPSKMWL
ncbi:hypothetical protein [Ruegeria hyattellae]|uniref:hypothetical protein n=1 Tax=Ruegeria hyattellae TaxID=3233337 RepID=UPI00355BE856